MRILAAERRAGSPRFTPRQLIRLAPTPSGALDLCFGTLRQVPLEALVLVAVVVPVIERKPVLSLVLILRDQPRPFRVAARDIDFEAFASEEDSLEACLRVLLGHLGDRHSDLLISTETAAFLRGTPVPQVQEVELANLASSWLTALDPSLEDAHPLLPEGIDKPQPAPPPLPEVPTAPSSPESANKEATPSEPPKATPLGPQNPNPPPPLLPPFGPSLSYGVDRLDTITRGLGEPLPRVVVSAQRRLTFLLTALGIMIPAMLYLTAIGALGYTAWRYAGRGTRLFEVSDQGERLWNIADLAFVIPVAVCLLFLLTLLEPLLVHRPPPPAPRLLERGRNSVFFSFLERLARTVGAAVPKLIEVTTDADLGLHRQPRRRGGRLVLTLGLPLIAGLTLEQFAGLLTGEFTAFLRRPESFAVRFVRWVDDRFGQLLADCTDLQEKRKAGVGQLVGRVGLTPLVDLLLFLVFGLTRALISLLVWITSRLRGFLEQELAKDASTNQEQLVGTSVAAATTLWASALRQAQRQVVLGFDESRFDASPPPDHLPAQVVLLALDEWAARGTSATSDPKGEEGTQPKFRSTLPATVLFQDFNQQARRLTAEFYSGLKRPRFELEPFADFVERQNHLAREKQAAERFFGGALLVERALPVAPALPADPRELPQQAAALAAARQKFTAALPNHRHLLTQFDRAASYRQAAREAQLLMSGGLTLEPQDFGLEEWTPEAAQAMEKTASAHLRQAQALLKNHEMQAGRRLMSALTLLSNADISKRCGAADWLPQVPLLLSALAAVNRAFPHLLHLSRLTNLVLALKDKSQDKSGTERRRLDELLSLETAKLQTPLSTLRQALLQEKDLFHQHGFDLELATDGIPADLISASRDVLQRVHRHYQRCLSRLGWMAERLEQAAGLPPLPEVEALAKSRPWRF